MKIKSYQGRITRWLLLPALFFVVSVFAQDNTPLTVKKTVDFSITGSGENAAWERAEWVPLVQLDKGKPYESKFKVLYSATGIYVLFYGEDERINSPFENDFDPLFRADVFEVFFHPQPSTPLYFEYEISPLNRELVLLIPNLKGIQGWLPWNYTGERKVKKNVVVKGGPMENKAAIQSWTAELFFPYGLLSPLENTPPQSGTVWNANFCRLDYDSGSMIKWSWSPIKSSFHEYKKYRSIKFE